MHLAGATVLRGPMGFGHSSRLHTAKILRLSEDLPMVIEIVDTTKERYDLAGRAGADDDRRSGHPGKGGVRGDPRDGAAPEAKANG